MVVNADPADGSNESDAAVAGTFECRYTLDGVTAALPDTDGSRYGTLVQVARVTISGSTLTVACRSTVTRSGSALPFKTEFWVRQWTPEGELTPQLP